MTLIDQLIAYETNTTNPADGRQVIRDERQAVHVATQRVERLTRAKLRSTQPRGAALAEAELAEERTAAIEHLNQVKAEARRTLGLWS